MNRRAILAMSVVLVLAILVGWFVIFRPVPRSDLTGTYLCSYPYGTETLVLQSDGHYSQLVGVAGSPAISHSGSWHLNAHHQVVLEDALIVDNGFASPATRPVVSNWILDVRHTMAGAIVMPVNEDVGLQFQKVENRP
jgi:hypothetical protein